MAVLYKRTSKERRKQNHPTQNNLLLLTIYVLSSNLSSSSDVISEFFAIILHTTNITLINTTMSYHACRNTSDNYLFIWNHSTAFLWCFHTTFILANNSVFREETFLPVNLSGYPSSGNLPDTQYVILLTCSGVETVRYSLVNIMYHWNNDTSKLEMYTPLYSKGSNIGMK